MEAGLKGGRHLPEPGDEMGGAFLGKRNRSNHTATRKAMEKVLGQGVSKDRVGCFGVPDKCGSPGEGYPRGWNVLGGKGDAVYRKYPC